MNIWIWFFRLITCFFYETKSRPLHIKHALFQVWSVRQRMRSGLQRNLVWCLSLCMSHLSESCRTGFWFSAVFFFLIIFFWITIWDFSPFWVFVFHSEEAKTKCHPHRHLGLCFPKFSRTQSIRVAEIQKVTLE